MIYLTRSRAIPLISYVCLLAVGLGLASQIAPDFHYSTVVVAFLCILGVFARRTRALASITLAVTTGVLWLQVQIASPQDTQHITNVAHEPRVLLCAGEVVSRPRIFDTSWRALVDVERCLHHGVMQPVWGRIELRSYDSADAPVGRGDFVRFQGRVRAPPLYLNPGTASKRWHYAAQGIDRVVNLRDSSWVYVLERDSTMLRHIDELHARLLVRLAQLPIADGHRSLLRALLFGDSQQLSEDDWQRYRQVGVVHVLVVSGLHVALLAACCWWFARLLLSLVPWLLRRNYVMPLADCIAWCGVAGFVAFSGARLPAFRALCFLSLLFMGRLMQRRYDVWAALAATVLLMCALAPASLMTVSFQLSFLAVVGIALGHALFPGLRGWRALFLMTLAPSVMVLPLVAYYFHELTFMGLLSNPVLVPFVSFILLPLGVVTLAALWLVPTLAIFIAKPLALCVDLFQCMLDWFSQYADWLHGDVYLAWGHVLTWYAGCALLIVLWSRRAHIQHVGQYTMLVSLILICSVSMLPAMRSQEHLQLDVFDVGQGSAMLLTLPNGTRYMIDAGGSVASSAFDVGKFILAPSLHRLGVRRITHGMLSHFHPDHYGGFAYLAEEFGMHTLYTNGSQARVRDELWEAVATRMQHEGVAMQSLERGTEWEEAGVQFRVLHPNHTRYADENDRSLVLEITHGSQRWLLTGDIEAIAEQDLLSAQLLQPVEVIVVPHHGSNTSSGRNFVRAVSPQHAIISCGRDNRYGFPRPQVLAAYDEVGAQVHRTDLHGYIRMRSDGDTTTIQRFQE